MQTKKKLYRLALGTISMPPPSFFICIHSTLELWYWSTFMMQLIPTSFLGQKHLHLNDWFPEFVAHKWSCECRIKVVAPLISFFPKFTSRENNHSQWFCPFFLLSFHILITAWITIMDPSLVVSILFPFSQQSYAESTVVPQERITTEHFMGRLTLTNLYMYAFNEISITRVIFSW